MGDNLFAKTEKFVKGYVTVYIEGIFLEKFTNLCAVNCLPFWNVKRYGIAKMVGSTTISGYRKMRHIAKKCGCRVKICRRRGVPFIVHKYRKRKIFVVGVILFFVLIKISGLFIWQVDVIGDTLVSKKQIVMQVEELGVKAGTKKSSIDIKDLASKLMVKRDDLSWVGVEIDGMRLKVRVVEKAKVPNRIDEKAICNIVASKPGMIIGINTLKGTQMVEVNDIVDKGDIIVSGVIEMEQFPDRTEYVHSLAEIEAKVWYERSKTLKLSSTRQNEEIELFAYNIALDKINKQIPKDAKISHISKNVSYGENSVTVNVVMETIEDIGIEETF